MKRASTSTRHRYIDWARGLAVLIMIQAHTLDAWTRPSARVGHAFVRLTILGGFAAPLFLWLAGIGSVLSAESTARRTGSRRSATEAVCRRGLEIFVLAFLFRLQAFVVSPGNPLIALFRVDILNVMGPSIVLVALIWGAVRGRESAALVFAVLAASIAMVTPVVRAAPWVDLLPVWGQWYVRPAGEYTTFTLLPWSGFVLAGAASGVLLARVRATVRVQMAFAGAGLSLAVLGFYFASLPSIYREASFWTSSPTYFAIRLGVLLVTLAALYALERWIPLLATLLGPLERFGQSSLLVYWIHVELVYGYATWPMHHRLPLWGTVFANAAFSVLMFGAILLAERLADRWRSRRPDRGDPGVGRARADAVSLDQALDTADNPLLRKGLSADFKQGLRNLSL